MEEVLRIKFAQAEEPKVSEAFARAIAVTLPINPDRPSDYVSKIVELLKWPSASQSGATDALLETLHDRLSDGVPAYARPAGYRLPPPTREAGLDATVKWVAQTYPEIGLDSPPTYPEAGSTGAGW